MIKFLERLCRDVSFGWPFLVSGLCNGAAFSLDVGLSGRVRIPHSESKAAGNAEKKLMNLDYQRDCVRDACMRILKRLLGSWFGLTGG